MGTSSACAARASPTSRSARSNTGRRTGPWWPRRSSRWSRRPTAGSSAGPSRPMPEGHTLHRLAIDHRRDFGGKVVSVSSPQGRFADEAKRLDERLVEDVEAYGKHLFYDF